MEITIKKKNVEEVDRYLKSFLKQKSLTEDEIRNFTADDTDLYKEILLEEYFAGALTVLCACGIEFSADDKSSELDIEFEQPQLVCDPISKIMVGFEELKEQVKVLVDKMQNEIDPNELLNIEKEIHGKFYSYLGTVTILNKLGTRIVSEKIFDDNLKQYLVAQKDDVEIKDYLEVNKEINDLTNYFYEKFNILKILSVTQFKKNLKMREENVLEALMNARRQNDVLPEGSDRRKELIMKQFSDIDDNLVDLNEELIIKEAKHQSAILNFSKKHFGYIIK